MSLSNVAILESSTLQLNCTVSGYPVPQITWRRTGQRVLSDDVSTVIEEELSQGSTSVVSSSLVIQGVNSSHGGLYECVAENSLGSDSTQATVTVYGKSKDGFK